MIRQRKQFENFPAHIDAEKVPKGIYWDNSGNGRWFIFIFEDGKKRRRTVAGPSAKLSDLCAIIESQGERSGTIDWIANQYHSSRKFARLAKSTQDDYEYCRSVLVNLQTAIGAKFGTLQASRIRNTHLQKIIDRLENDGTPTKANKILRYCRLLFRWALNRGLVSNNPAQGLEAATERKRQRLPTDRAYYALLNFAIERGRISTNQPGSMPAYLWTVMEIGYLCRLRGIETITLTDAHATQEGVRTNRRKGSRDNIVQWSPRLRIAWDTATALRDAIVKRHSLPICMKPDDRPLFIASRGSPLRKTSLDTAWQRFVRAALAEGVITPEERFSIHDLKRKGGTNTEGTRAQKQDALGVSEAMMKVYDKSVPVVKPSGNVD